MSLASVVGKISPLLGAALNTVVPGGSLIVSALAHLFGVSGTDESTIADAIAADPMAAEKLKEFEISHRYDLEQLTVQDRISARQMNSDTTKETGKQDYMLHALGLGAFLMVFVYVILGYFIPAQFSENVFHDLLNICTFVFSFYFGGMYIQARQAPNQDVVLPPPAQTR